MKVVLAFPLQDMQTGLYIRNALNQLGCEIREVDAKLNPEKLFIVCKSFKPDFVFCSRTKELLPEIQQIKMYLKDTVVCIYNVDARFKASDFGLDLIKLFSYADIFYTKASGLIDDYESLLKNPIVKCLPEAIDPSIQKHTKVTDDDIRKYSCDIMFAGSRNDGYKTPFYCSGRTGLIDALLFRGYNINLYGYYGNSTKVINEEHNKACMCAKIVLGHCGWSTVALANSARDFRVTGAGGFLLTEKVVGMEELFVIDKECVVYEDIRDCISKIDFYLKKENDELRNEIAFNGHERTHRDHKFIDRMKVVIDDVENFKLEKLKR